MTKFADQLFDDLTHEHGAALTRITPPPPKRHITTRRALLAVGGTGVAAAATLGALAATGGAPTASVAAPKAGNENPAYAITNNPNGTITLAVYKKSGITKANAKLKQLGDSQVVVVPVEPGCPSMATLPAPAVSAKGQRIRVASGRSEGGSVTVSAQGIPAGDIMVVAFETTNGRSAGASTLTSGPVPSCLSLPSSSGNV